MARARLTRDLIVDACEALLAESDEKFTLQRLGARLEADPSAIYRHFRDRDELLRAVGDRILAGIVDDLPTADGWRVVVTEVCVRLRRAHLRHPDLSALVRDRPPLQPNEIAITEALLGALCQSGLPDDEVVAAYHGLVELAVGSAVIDASMDAMDAAERAAEYDRWRRTYGVLAADRFPHSVALASKLYPGTADERFVSTLAKLLDGLAPG